MGLFNRAKSPEAAYQESLVGEYASAYKQMGMPAQEANQLAAEFVQSGVEEVAARGWQNHPANYGDVLLSQQANNAELAASLNKRRDDGVTDDDIRWWWNMPSLDRVLIEKSDEQNRVAAFMSCLQEGMDADEAAVQAFKLHPKYGDLADGGGPDRPIPIELKRRIVEWSERQQSDPETYLQKLSTSSSFNALVRTEIAACQL